MSDIEQRLREAMDGVTAELHRLLEASHRRQPDIDAITAKYSSDWHLRHVPQINCADGFEMSVQASAFHYCTPRDSYGPWNSVEVGFPSERVEAFMLYIDGGDETDATDTVYGYVPIEIVAKAIVDHGGFEQAASPREADHG